MSKYRLFIAEDDPLVRQGLVSMSTEIGHEVVGVASNGTEAVEKISAVCPDLVLMDIKMPGLDGLDAISQLHNKVSVPFIIISAYQAQDLLDKANELGVFGFLPKPVDEFALRSSIEITISRFNAYKSAVSALEERKVVERAKGIYMEKTGISEPEVMKKMQKMARDSNKKLIEIAREIIDADKLFRF